MSIRRVFTEVRLGVMSQPLYIVQIEVRIPNHLSAVLEGK